MLPSVPLAGCWVPCSAIRSEVARERQNEVIHVHAQSEKKTLLNQRHTVARSSALPNNFGSDTDTMKYGNRALSLILAVSAFTAENVDRRFATAFTPVLQSSRSMTRTQANPNHIALEPRSNTAWVSIKLVNAFWIYVGNHFAISFIFSDSLSHVMFLASLLNSVFYQLPRLVSLKRNTLLIWVTTLINVHLILYWKILPWNARPKQIQIPMSSVEQHLQKLSSQNWISPWQMDLHHSILISLLTIRWWRCGLELHRP